MNFHDPPAAIVDAKSRIDLAPEWQVYVKIKTLAHLVQVRIGKSSVADPFIVV